MKTAQEIRLALIAKIAPRLNAAVIAAFSPDQTPHDRDMPTQHVGEALDFSACTLEIV